MPSSRSRGVGFGVGGLPRWLLLLLIFTFLLITNLNIHRTHAQDETAAAETTDPVDPSIVEADTPVTTAAATDTNPASPDDGAVPEGHSGDDEMPAPAPTPAPAPDAQSDAPSEAEAEAESGSQFETITEAESQPDTPAPVTVPVLPTAAAKRKFPTGAPASGKGKSSGKAKAKATVKATKAPVTKLTKVGKRRATKPTPGAGGAGKAGWKGRRPIKVFPTNPDPTAHGKQTPGWVPGRAGAGPPLFPHAITDDVPANVSYHVNIGTIPDGANIINDDKSVWIDPDTIPNMSPTIDRSDSERDVMLEGSAAVLEPGQFIVPEDLNFADFYVSRTAFPDDFSNNRSISLQQPFIFADFKSINAYVTAWGHTQFIQPIPLRSQAITDVTPEQVSAIQRSNDTNSDNLIFTVQFECKVKVASRIRLTVKARLYETTEGHRSRKIVTFQFWKECAALEVPIAADGATAAPGSGSGSASASDGTSIPGFNIGLSPGGDEVVHHGTAQDGFGSRARTPTTKAPQVPRFDDDDDGGMQQAQEPLSPTKPAQTIYTINETTSTLYLYVRYQRKTSLTISRPFIFAHRPDIVMGEVGGPLTLTAKTTLRPYVTYLVAVTLSCKANTTSSSLVTVAFKFPDDARLSVSFTFSKSCAGIQIADGIAGSGVNVGYARSWNDVVNDGVTQPYWSKVNQEDDQKQTNPNPSVLFSPDQTNATFIISLRPGYPPVSYLPPLVSSYTPDGVVVARPTVCGSLTEQKQLTSDEKLALNVEFNCIRKKTVSITVSIPLRPSGSLDWVMHKICDADPEVAVEQPTDLSPVPGLNVGLQPHAHGIAVDGIPNAHYTWTNSISTLATFVKATFVTICFSKAKDAVDDIYLGTPELTSTLEIAKPVLSGMSDHEVISSDHSVCLRIIFNCYLQGSTMFTLMVPIEAPENEQPPRAEPFIISFMKKCPAPGEESDADVVQAWAGGVDIHGFYIGTGPTKSDVVKDGFPTKYYYGQRIKKTPQWDSIMVPANMSSIRLFLRYATPQTKSSAENDLDLWDRVAFQDPYIIAHTIQAKPELSGEAATEGAMQLDADPLELDVTFNCVYQGVAVTTIMLPVHPLGTITFTIPKMCEGADAPRGVRISGLNIGTSPDTSDVVKDGFTSEKFLSWSTEDKNAYHSDKEVERFWVSHSDQGEAQINAIALRGRDPIVYCVRNTCRASLNHSLHASDADSEIVITSTPSPIDVIITCIWPYPSAVTIKIPILPVGTVAFTWITSCKTENNGGEGSALSTISYPDDPNFRGQDPSVDNVDEEMAHASGDMDLVDEYRGGPHQHVGFNSNPEQQDYSWRNVYVDVGTGGIAENDPNSLNEDPIDQMLLDDVISRDIPRPRYALPAGANSKSDEVIDSSASAIVRSAVSTFFITPQGGNQKYLSAQVMIRGRNICEPKFIGDFGIEKGEMEEGRHSVMHLEYNCLTAGMATILISIPLEPVDRGHLSWRVVKLCPATTPKVVESGWTITNIMYTIAMMIAATFAGAGCLYYKKIKQLVDAQQYAPVSTKPTMSNGDVEMDVAESSRAKKHADFISDSE